MLSELLMTMAWGQGPESLTYLIVVCDVKPGIVGDDMIVYCQDCLRVRLDPGNL